MTSRQTSSVDRLIRILTIYSARDPSVKSIYALLDVNVLCGVWSGSLRSSGTSNAAVRCPRNSTSSAASILLLSIIGVWRKGLPRNPVTPRLSAQSQCLRTRAHSQLHGENDRKKQRDGIRDKRIEAGAEITGLNSTSSYCSYQS